MGNTVSHKMSYMLRHHPEEFNITIVGAGWAPVSKVLSALNIKLSELEDIVSSDKKDRYSFKDGKTLIRANQGHSFDIDLELPPIEPPEFLFHGTIENVIHLIKETGIQKMNRHHVHLSEDLDTASNVASRRKSKNVILKIEAKKMFDAGYEFFITENNVWLTDNVPFDYIWLKS